MLVIRDAQMHALSLGMVRQFAARTAAHIQECFPESYEALGEEGALAAISWGIEKARGYGLRQEYDILRFINLLFALGFEFENDPAHAWAAEILADPEWSPGARMDALMARALEQTSAEPKGSDAAA